MLKLPKRLHPDFSRPGVKPVCPVEIDWSNPLTKGLRELYVFINGVCVNLVDNYVCASSSGVTYSRNNAIFNNNSKITLKEAVPVLDALTITGRLKPDTINYDGVYGDKNSSNWGSDAGVSVNIRSDGSLALKVGTDETRSSASKLAANKKTTFSCCHGAGNQRIYFDGVESGYSVQVSSTSYTKSSIAARIGTYYAEGSSWSYDGEIEFICVHERALSSAEIRSLHDNLYQLLKPANDLYFFPAAAGGGPTYTLTAGGGSYTLTGNAATLTTSRKITAGQGSFTLTGGAAILSAGRKIVAGQGIYALTGGSAALVASRKLTAAQGTFTLTGGDVTFTYGAPATYTLTADGGSYTLTGNATTFIRHLRLSLDPGSYALSGSANLVYSGAQVESFTGGNYDFLNPPTRKKIKTAQIIKKVAERQIEQETKTHKPIPHNSRIAELRKALKAEQIRLKKEHSEQLEKYRDQTIIDAIRKQEILHGIITERKRAELEQEQLLIQMMILMVESL